jgi:hypothetical protein
MIEDALLLWMESATSPFYIHSPVRTLASHDHCIVGFNISSGSFPI